MPARATARIQMSRTAEGSMESIPYRCPRCSGSRSHTEGSFKTLNGLRQHLEDCHSKLMSQNGASYMDGGRKSPLTLSFETDARNLEHQLWAAKEAEKKHKHFIAPPDDTLQNVRQELRDNRQKNVQLFDALNSAGDQIERLKKSTDRVVKEQQEALQKLHEKLEQKECEMEKVKWECDQLGLEKRQLEDRVRGLTSHKDEKESIVASLREEIEKRENELDNKESELSTLTNFISDATKKEAKARQELEKFIEGLFQRAESAEDGLHRLRRQLAMTESHPHLPALEAPYTNSGPMRKVPQYNELSETPAINTFNVGSLIASLPGIESAHRPRADPGQMTSIPREGPLQKSGYHVDKTSDYGSLSSYPTYDVTSPKSQPSLSGVLENESEAANETQHHGESAASHHLPEQPPRILSPAESSPTMDRRNASADTPIHVCTSQIEPDEQGIIWDHGLKATSMTTPYNVLRMPVNHPSPFPEVFAPATSDQYLYSVHASSVSYPFNQMEFNQPRELTTPLPSDNSKQLNEISRNTGAILAQQRDMISNQMEFLSRQQKFLSDGFTQLTLAKTKLIRDITDKARMSSTATSVTETDYSASESETDSESNRSEYSTRSSTRNVDSRLASPRSVSPSQYSPERASGVLEEHEPIASSVPLASGSGYGYGSGFRQRPLQQPAHRDKYRDDETLPTVNPRQKSSVTLTHDPKLARECRHLEALFCAFSYLDVKSLSQVAQVCKSWRGLSCQPALWKRVKLCQVKMSSRYLVHISKFCTELNFLHLQGLTCRPKKPNENLTDYRKSTKGALELGLESLLRTSLKTLTTIRIIDCSNVLTSRCLWLASCFSRHLVDVMYISESDPAGPEVIWSLGAGCRQINKLILPPLYPNQQPHRFTNLCVYNIGRCWPGLLWLSIGGIDVTRKGLAAIARFCGKLQWLELDHMCEVDETTALVMCKAGLKGLRQLHLTFTPVSPKAILQFSSACAHLEMINVRIGISDYFEDTEDTRNRQEFASIIAKLKKLQQRHGLSRVLQLNVDYGLESIKVIEETVYQTDTDSGDE